MQDDEDERDGRDTDDEKDDQLRGHRGTDSSVGTPRYGVGSPLQRTAEQLSRLFKPLAGGTNDGGKGHTGTIGSLLLQGCPRTVPSLDFKRHRRESDSMLLQYIANLVEMIRTRDDERGQTLVEYGLLLALIAIVVIAVLVLLGPAVSGIFQSVNDQL